MEAIAFNRVKLGEIFKLKSGKALPHAMFKEGSCSVFGGNGLVGTHGEFMVDEPTLVIGRVGEYCGSVFITNPKSWITDNGLYPIKYLREVDIYFLKESLTQANLNQYSQKTGQPSISQSILNSIEIVLPPIEKQRQIALLFRSLETSIEQIEGQEKNMVLLQKHLIDGLLKTEPKFGDKLNCNNTHSICFGNIVDCIEQHDKKKNCVKRFIGLEDIKSDSFQLETWGNIEEGTTFTKRFNKGDILFGKRRAYLKKVAVADFDGICSGDILVFRPKKEKILRELLPFYVSSEAFVQHAVRTSAGSLSPRTKWKDLKEFNFQIPDLEIQSDVLEVFSQIQKTLFQLKEQRTNLKNLKQNLLNEILG